MFVIGVLDDFFLSGSISFFRYRVSIKDTFIVYTGPSAGFPQIERHTTRDAADDPFRVRIVCDHKVTGYIIIISRD